MPKTVIISLDLYKDEEEYVDYAERTAKGKIDLIAKKIEENCQSLSETTPDAMWMIGWAEYAIYESFTKRAVTHADKKYFKDKMSELAQKYPNLVIIGGTIQSYKHHAKIKLEKLKEFYKQELAEMINSEEKKDTNFKLHQHIFLALEEIERLIQLSDVIEVPFVCNTCLVFQGKDIFRHDKMAPINETLFNEHLINAVYQIGKDERALPYCFIVHPITKEKLLIGLEICREHDFALLKQALKINKINVKPFIQFILSAGKKVKLKNVCAAMAMQFDERIRARLISLTSKIPEDILVFSDSLTKPEMGRVGPYEILYPFELKLLDELNTIIKSSDKKEIWAQIAAVLINNEYSEFLTVGELGACLLQEINKNKTQLLEEKGSFVNNLLNRTFLFSPNPNKDPQEKISAELAIEKLKQMVDAETIKYPRLKDYCAAEPPSLLTDIPVLFLTCNPGRI